MSDYLTHLKAARTQLEKAATMALTEDQRDFTNDTLFLLNLRIGDRKPGWYARYRARTTRLPKLGI